MATEYWCHECRQSFASSAGPKCTNCNSDFVEEIHPGQEDNPEDYYIQGGEGGNGEVNIETDPMFQNLFQALHNLRANVQMRRENAQNNQNGVPTSAQGQGQPQRQRPQPPMFQIHIGGRDGGARMLQLPIFSNLFQALGMEGNPADYGFGRSMEDIITQIMNQSQNHGPPPASKEAVESLPKVKVTEDDVKAKAACSVCMVEYEKDEEVTQMPCKHIFHDGCLKPWLEIHNSCPVCRYELKTDDPDYEVRRGMNGSPGGRPSSQDSGEASTATNASENQNGEGNVDLD